MSGSFPEAVGTGPKVLQSICVEFEILDVWVLGGRGVSPLNVLTGSRCGFSTFLFLL